MNPSVCGDVELLEDSFSRMLANYMQAHDINAQMAYHDAIRDAQEPGDADDLPW
jgi:hypothetical protein